MEPDPRARSNHGLTGNGPYRFARDSAPLRCAPREAMSRRKKSGEKSTTLLTTLIGAAAIVERSRWRGGGGKVWPFGHGVDSHRVRRRACVLDLLARALVGVPGK